MDRTEIERLACEHGDAVVAGDQTRIIADIVDEIHPLIPQLAAALPQPLENARVASAEVFADHAETVTEYSSPTATISVKARWEDRSGGRPQIVSAAPL
jgi:hypothetical protein